MDIHRRLSPLQFAVGSAIVVVSVLAAATASYLSVQQPTLTDGRVLVYPVVWSTAAIAAAVWVSRTVRVRPRRWLGAAVGVSYTVALLWLSGTLGASAGMPTSQLALALPGWGPILLYDNGLVSLAIVPFTLVAYLSLGYIVAVLVSAAGSARTAALGMASCVSCAAPLLLAVAGLFGGSQATTMVASAGYDLATVVLLVTFGLLVRAAQKTAKPCEISPMEEASQ